MDLGLKTGNVKRNLYSVKMITQKTTKRCNTNWLTVNYPRIERDRIATAQMIITEMVTTMPPTRKT